MVTSVGASRVTEIYNRTGTVLNHGPRSYTPRTRDTVQFSKEALDKLKTFSGNSDYSSEEREKRDRELKRSLNILMRGEDAGPEQIRKAYIEAIKRYHPDRFSNLPPEFRKLAEEKAKEINSAYSRLRNL